MDRKVAGFAGGRSPDAVSDVLINAGLRAVASGRALAEFPALIDSFLAYDDPDARAVVIRQVMERFRVTHPAKYEQVFAQRGQ